MKARHKIQILSLCAGLAACTNDAIVEEMVMGVSDSTVKEITVTLPEIPNDVFTRTNFTINETGLSVTWEENDAIGIFPNKGYQVSFTTGEGAGGNTVTFNGGGWGLKNDSTYAAYYPFDKENFNRSNKTILLDYTGQKQIGNANADHLKAYDYLASGAVNPEDGYLNLELKRLSSIVRIDLTLPSDVFAGTGAQFSGVLTLSSDIPFIQKAELDISGTEPLVVPVETSHAMTIDLQGVPIPTDRHISVYMTLSPRDYQSGTVGISLIGGFYGTSDNGEKSLLQINNGWTGNFRCFSSIPLKNLEAGKPYLYSVVMESKEASEIIKQAKLIHEICLDHWDADHDGFFSKVEAAGITDIGTIFAGRSITSVGLGYFTGLTTIGDGAFKDCVNLERFTLPKGITSIGSEAFSGCMSLISFDASNSNLQSIGDHAFYYCYSLFSVKLPDSVTSIGDYAFSNCGVDYRFDIYKDARHEFNLPSNLESIGNYAFYYCYTLSGDVVIPESVTQIGECAFNGCQNITSIVLPEGLKRIEAQTFMGCRYLESVYFPTSLEYIGDYAFQSSGLKEITIPEGVSFGNAVFNSNRNLTKVNFPNNITAIEQSMFSGCDSLKEIVIPDGVTTIGSSAFSNCTSLTDILVPVGVETIGSRAFFGCTSLTEIDIPNTVTTIGSQAFYGCTSLTEIVIPDGVTTISSAAFNGCTSLSGVTIPVGVQVIDSRAFSECSSLASIVIPNTVRFIGPSAFYGCTSLTDIVIPCKSIYGEAFREGKLKRVTIGEEVSDIGLRAFMNQNELESITILAVNPPAIYSETFINTNDCPIYVPASSLEAYQTAFNWTYYYDRIRAIE